MRNYRQINIRLNKNLRIIADDYNFIVKKGTYDDESEHEYNKYFGSLKGLVDFLLKERIKNSTAMNLHSLMDDVEKGKQEILDTLQEAIELATGEKL